MAGATAYKNSSGQISEPVFITDDNANQTGIASNPLVVAPSASSASAATVLSRVASSADAGNPAVAKAATGNVTGWSAVNTAGAITYLQLYNKATAPVLGTDAPTWTIAMPANSRVFDTIPTAGVHFTTGIAFAFTTDVAGATGAGAAVVTAFALLGA